MGEKEMLKAEMNKRKMDRNAVKSIQKNKNKLNSNKHSTHKIDDLEELTEEDNEIVEKINKYVNCKYTGGNKETFNRLYNNALKNKEIELKNNKEIELKNNKEIELKNNKEK